jgi:hypothetical protein
MTKKTTLITLALGDPDVLEDLAPVVEQLHHRRKLARGTGQDK